MPSPRAHNPQVPERLMRYRFDSPTQARYHLHVMEGRQLLFFPDPFLDVRERQPVLVELCFTGLEQSLIVRGEVHSLETGAFRGAWLELFSMRLFDGLQLATGSPRRQFRRLNTDFLVRVERPGRPSSVARLADVSAGGARVAGAGGAWAPGDDIFLTDLAGGPRLRGSVIRSREGEIAIAFDRIDATTRRNAMRLLEAAFDRWRNAREGRHPAGCDCLRGGALLEPLLPRSAHRRVEGL
ncbi:MAG: PilZ domain-containing protein [Myxococcales bacterium]